MWKNCFKVPRCFFFSKELMETKGWVPRTRVEAQSFSALPDAKLEGSAHPSCAGAAPFQPRGFWSHGDFGEQAVGQPPLQLAQLQPKKKKKKENFEASEIQLLAGRLILLMGPGSLVIISLMYFCFVLLLLQGA